ncbi:hypothetical protein [Aquimarina celericrescens]|uniref:Carboxypeptidase regulatory-like domain-containing protein n=1 Tax=Aquimarina celericrescens TaxID=1964542 RepID=A0ABW5ASB6_9FLAO|nr:hypothetical protein [Aquimarina celericrescens]
MPSNDPGGVQGFYAINTATGDIYYSERIGQYANNTKIFDIPEGIYELGAYDGYSKGASSEIITLNQSLVGEDGFIQIDLEFWSE